MPKTKTRHPFTFFAMKKGYPACLGKKDGDELLPRFFSDYLLNHEKDPFETTRIQWKVSGRVFLSWLTPTCCQVVSESRTLRETWPLKGWWFHNVLMVSNFLFTLNCGKHGVKHTHMIFEVGDWQPPPLWGICWSCEVLLFLLFLVPVTFYLDP